MTDNETVSMKLKFGVIRDQNVRAGFPGITEILRATLSLEIVKKSTQPSQEFAIVLYNNLNSRKKIESQALILNIWRLQTVASMQTKGYIILRILTNANKIFINDDINDMMKK